MSCQRPDPDRDVHEATIAALPWLVNGRLDEAQAAPLRAHLTHCERCRDWQRFDQSLAAAFDDEPRIDVAPHAAYARFAAKLEARAARRVPWPFARRLEGSKERPRNLLVLIAAQTAAIVLLAAGLALQASRAPSYRTLSGADTPVETTRVVRLVVDDAMSTGQLRDTLRRFDARIVAGPSELGVLTIEIGSATGATDALSVARRLRDEPGVLFAEPVGSAGQ
jgi:hypothetical protein